MDNISEKLGLYDFFNVIGVGAIFLIHFIFLYPGILENYDMLIDSNSIKLAGLVVISFLFGLIIQEISAFFDEKVFKIKKNKIRNFLIDPKIIDNNLKLKKYKNYAKEILRKNEFEINDELTQEQNAYVYGYIVYYIEHRNRNKKFEKMRALYDMSKSLVCCMAILFFICCFCYFKTLTNTGVNELKLIITIIYLSISIIIFSSRTLRCMNYKIRMLMGVYTSCLESKNSNE